MSTSISAITPAMAIIGGGPAGYTAAIRAAQLGAEVTLIEQNKLGGTCLNAGCIPTKALIHGAELYAQLKSCAHLGINVSPSLDFSKMQSYKASIVDRLSSGVATLLKSGKIKVIFGTAAFADSHTLAVTTSEGRQLIAADRFIIAAGSVPSLAPIPGIESSCCIGSTEALELKEVPDSLIVVGGGVIGIEIASIYQALGSRVTILERLPQLLPSMDRELTQRLSDILQEKGIQILKGVSVSRIEETPEKQALVSCVLQDGAPGEFRGSKALVCVGRSPNTQFLNLKNAGVTAGDDGAIKTDPYMRTNAPNIYAVGDCTGNIMLAHVASSQGEAAVEHAMGISTLCDTSASPACIYTNPELASVGITEETAIKRGIPYTAGVFPLSSNGKAMIENGQDGLIKIIAAKRIQKILGVHILGPRATDLIAEGALALRLEATVNELVSTIHAHPTVSEGIREAALDIWGRSIHKINQ